MILDLSRSYGNWAKREKEIVKNFGKWHFNVSHAYELFLPQSYYRRRVIGEHVNSKGQIVEDIMSDELFLSNFMPTSEKRHNQIEAKRKSAHLKSELKRLLELREGVSKFLGEKI